MTIFEFRKNLREKMESESRSEMTLDEAAKSLLVMRDELYDNKFVANPVQVSHLLDVAWLLSSPKARIQWELNANKKVDAMVSEYAAELGRKGGTAKSEIKAKSSAENGRKGGRPKKEKSEQTKI